MGNKNQNQTEERISIALVLPAFKEEGNLEKSLTRVSRGVQLFPQYSFTLYTTDDCSPDRTTDEILKLTQELGLDTQHYRNDENLGLVQTLKNAYQRVIASKKHDAILKTDLDNDYDQEAVLRRMIPYATEDFDVVVGTRWRNFEEKEQPYEYDRRTEILRLVKEYLGNLRLDPPSAGTQLYKANSITKILANKNVANYDKRWGLDFLVPLVAARMGMNTKVINIENGSYDPNRRPNEKVKAQYNSYTETIAALVNKTPEEISDLYERED